MLQSHPSKEGGALYLLTYLLIHTTNPPSRGVRSMLGN